MKSKIFIFAAVIGCCMAMGHQTAHAQIYPSNAITTVNTAQVNATANEKKHCRKTIADIHNPKTKDVIVISHRADWRNFPENSIPAIESSIAMGVDMVEIDLKMTKDSVLVLMHDKTVDRTTNGHGEVSDLTYAEISQLNLVSGHGCETEWKVPTLEEVLNVCRNRITINIDQGLAYYNEVHKLLVKTGTLDQIIIKGNKTPAEVYSNLSEYKDNITYMPIINFRSKEGPKLLAECLKGKAPVAYEVCWTKWTPEVSEACKEIIASGAKLWVNTLWNSLNGGLSDDRAFYDRSVYTRILSFGASMVQTDRPEMLIGYLKKHHRH
ncbi:MAG: glycerophosphodiester phosphodiesterase family protein [Bacteroidales bacterium]|jgi:glycerophosphoryl diester phosphodiesterase|nr:glycerophosphodiester phosphodiesterase family protein [Bacteroidales bacterium]MCI2122244.1 glycerophosphodiester phosphodiesterase family protein [Bacteroidales bacterium]MCI2144804.1 glycerophosphodiester phosphodiesterase family protein [Bacteroidales bacterium]